MRGTSPWRTKTSSKSSKCLALLLTAALLTAGTGCSLDSFGPFKYVVKMGYNSFATMINAAFFGAPTTDVIF